VWGKGGSVAYMFKLGIRFRSVVSFTPRPLYPQGKSDWHPLDRRSGGTQNKSGCCVLENNLSPLLGIELRFLGLPTYSLITTLTPSRLV
jgi:hypothetical protein